MCFMRLIHGLVCVGVVKESFDTFCVVLNMVNVELFM